MRGGGHRIEGRHQKNTMDGDSFLAGGKRATWAARRSPPISARSRCAAAVPSQRCAILNSDPGTGTVVLTPNDFFEHRIDA